MAQLQDVVAAIKQQSPDKLEYFRQKLLATPEDKRQAAVDKLAAMLKVPSQASEPRSAYASFQAGKPNTTLTPDEGPNAGKEMLPGGAQAHPYIEAAASGLPAAGAIAGSVVGSLPLGPGALSALGAGSGAALGKAAENKILQAVGSSNAPKDIEEGTNEEFVKGAAAEVVGLAIPGVAGSAGNALKSSSKWFQSKVIPGMAKYVDRIGGPKALERLGNMLDDEGVTSVTGSVGKVYNRVKALADRTGSRVGELYGKITRASETAYTGAEVMDRATAEWAGWYKSTKGIEPGPEILANYKRALRTQFKERQLYTNSDIIAHARELEGSAWDQARLNLSTAKRQAGITLRDTNLKLAEEAGVEPALLEELRAASSAYRELAYAKTAAESSLKKGSNILDNVYELGKIAVGAELAGPVGAVAAKAATTTTAKTSAAMVTKAGAAVLNRVHAMTDNPVARRIIQVAAKQGLDAALKLHAYNMTNNPDYNDAYAGTR